MNERIDELVRRTAELEAAGPESRRREDLTERVLALGHTREYADRIYDVATEEGVDPGIAFELVITGVGVRDLAGPVPDQSEETQVEVAPAWVTDPVTPSPDVETEKRLRTTFRRLRSIADTSASPEEAVRAFVRAPDVGAVDY